MADSEKSIWIKTAALLVANTRMYLGLLENPAEYPKILAYLGQPFDP